MRKWLSSTPRALPTRSGAGITKLLGPAKWSYFYLYVVLGIYSRYVPGWMLARPYCTIRSYLSNMRKHDVDFLDGLGHAWLPGET